MRILFFSLLICCHVAAFCQNNNFNPEQRFSIEQLQNDFNFLRTKLEKKHPQLYLYTAKEKLSLFLDSLYQTITVPLTAQEFYQHISLLNSIIKDGHTMFLPGEQLTNYYNEHAGFFPFYIAVIKNKMYVRMNCSGDTAIPEGAEIVSINGITANDLLTQLTSRQIRDGNNETYPAWILTNYFAAYYSFSFGHSPKFSIAYKKNNTVQFADVTALTKDSILFYKKLRYPNKAAAATEGEGIVCTIDKQLNTATLTIKSFDNGILRSLYKQEFKSAVTKAFATIRDNNISNLIVDLRDNQGGDFKPGVILLSYLLNQPVVFLEGSGQERTVTPYANAFKGNLYMLVNGGSFSNSGIVSSYVELTKRAVFIGEETAGNKNIISGEPRDFILPNTKIIAEISTRKYRIRAADNDGHGIVPTYEIIPSIDDIINGRDPVKTFTSDLINKSKHS
ncbi:S41 family peptidase [Ferruginibacter sp. SUN106]|uniref:S41 family peptidase n=1 Tax=Ferruginibacter sp. SUN106 TaxID=2978348 RepID=UPI003D3606A1